MVAQGCIHLIISVQGSSQRILRGSHSLGDISTVRNDSKTTDHSALIPVTVIWQNTTTQAFREDGLDAPEEGRIEEERETNRNDYTNRKQTSHLWMS